MFYLQTGTRDDIEELIAESARHEINLGDYNEVLFDCIDMHRPGTALFLIDQGVDPDVYARVRRLGLLLTDILHLSYVSMANKKIE